MTSNPLTLGQLLQKMRERFETAAIDNAGFESKALLSGLMDFSTLDMATKAHVTLSCEQLERIEQAIIARCEGMPVYRILGWREFYALRFELSQDTLEPRADTEILVEHVIPFVNDAIAHKGACRILDLGTGTGAIALSVLDQCETARAVGVDQSPDAVQTARKNARNLGLSDRFEAVESDWFSNVTGTFDVIVSNPPYIKGSVIETLAPEVKDHDPHLALDGGADGLDAYRAICGTVQDFLAKDGILGLEIGFDQKTIVGELFTSGGFTILQEHKDLGGQDRVLIISRTFG